MELLAGPVHAPACSYSVSGSTSGGATVAAGSPLQLAITARDAYGNLASLPAGGLRAAATGPQGTVHFEVEVCMHILPLYLRCVALNCTVGIDSTASLLQSQIWSMVVCPGVVHQRRRQQRTAAAGRHSHAGRLLRAVSGGDRPSHQGRQAHPSPRLARHCHGRG